MEEWQVIAEIARTITSIGILLVWVRSEREDNQKLWEIVIRLQEMRIRKLEALDDDKPPQK